MCKWTHAVQTRAVHGSAVLGFPNELVVNKLSYNFIHMPPHTFKPGTFCRPLTQQNISQGQTFTTELTEETGRCFVSRVFDNSPLPGVNSNRMSFSSFLEFLWEKTQKTDCVKSILNLCIQTLPTFVRKAGPQERWLCSRRARARSRWDGKSADSFSTGLPGQVGLGQSENMGKRLGP